jgi:hypothetical protein
MDGSSLAFPAEHAYGLRVEAETAADGRVEPAPAHGEDPKHMPVRKEDDVTVALLGLLQESSDDPVHPSPHPDHVLASRAPIAPQRPLRSELSNLRCRHSLVLAVVPSHEIVVKRRVEPGQTRCLCRTGEGARECAAYDPSLETPTEGARRRSS